MMLVLPNKNKSNMEVYVMHIFESKPGEIGPDKYWCCGHEGYLYIGDTLEDLITILNTEWEDDKHLVG